jgi:putative DNA primase/helicase
MKDDLDTLEAACRAADGEATVDNHLSEPDEIARLAKLPKLEYDRQRDEAAARLGVRVATLDKRVREERSAADDGAATLPHWKVEPAPMPIEGAKLLDGLRQVFRRYIVLPKSADIALPLWVLHAWTFDSGEISPFIVLVSPVKRCGKTSVLILLYYLTPRSELASNISPSAIFRYIEEMRPTLLIDEADAFVKDNEELRGILNSGHTKAAANVIRNIEINGEHKPRRFSTWAPKAIATIRSLADTLEDRAVIVQLQRKPPGAKVERLRKRDNEWFAALRSHAARWSADNAAHLADPDPQIPNALNDRAADNWRPLIAIADLAGGEWPQLARQACLTLSGEAQEESLGVMLLADCRAAFGDDDMIRSADLVTRLSADPEGPWAEYNRGGKPITQRQVARLLSAFCIISVNVRPEIGPQGKGYRRTDFEEAWATYCPVKTPSRVQGGLSIRPNVPRPVKSAQVDGFASVPEAPWGGSKNGKLSHSHAGLDAWTDKKGGNGAHNDLATSEAPLCGNTVTGGNGHRDQNVTAAETFSTVPPDSGMDNLDVRDAGPIPEVLRRCDHCGQPATRADPLNGWDWPGRPDGIRLHGRCEAPWFDSNGQSEGGDDRL